LVVFQSLGNSTNSINLSHNPGASLFPAVAVSGQNVYVAWDDDSFGATQILYVRSTDGGRTFSEPLNLSNDTGESRNVAIAASGSDVYLVWEDNTPGNFEVFYSVSHDSGQSFSTAHSLSQTSGDSILPKIAVSGPDVYVIWQDESGGHSQISYSRSTDGGESFMTPRNLSQTPGDARSPVIAVSGVGVYAAWDDKTPGTHEIFFAHSSDGGDAFSVPQNISNSGTFATAPNLAATGNDVYLTWTERTTAENYEVFYSWSRDGGLSFSPPNNVSQSGTYAGASVIALDNRGVSLAWIEGVPAAQKGGPPMDYELYYTQGARGASTFAPAVNLSSTDGTTVAPAIAVSGSNAYVVFADDSSGNFEIIFQIVPARSYYYHF
jgi:hypothetical protein